MERLKRGVTQFLVGIRDLDQGYKPGKFVDPDIVQRDLRERGLIINPLKIQESLDELNIAYISADDLCKGNALNQYGAIQWMKLHLPMKTRRDGLFEITIPPALQFFSGGNDTEIIHSLGLVQGAKCAIEFLSKKIEQENSEALPIDLVKQQVGQEVLDVLSLKLSLRILEDQDKVVIPNYLLPLIPDQYRLLITEKGSKGRGK